MKIVTNCDDLRAELRSNDGRIAFVPTMGDLHDGHIALVTKARSIADRTVVSIFVNPKQFDDPSDFARYSKLIDADIERLKPCAVDILFCPTEEEIYGRDFETSLTPGPLSSDYEGRDRVGHFSGVCTVITILLNLIRPDFLVMGAKDFQQLRIVRQLCKDLKFETKVISVETVREAGGLAMSSRNKRLSVTGRAQAAQVYNALMMARSRVTYGGINSDEILSFVKSYLFEYPAIEVLYLAIVSDLTLQCVDTISEDSRILIAVRIEGVRLIDNMSLMKRSTFMTENVQENLTRDGECSSCLLERGGPARV